MAVKLRFPWLGASRRTARVFAGTVTIGGSGAVSSQAGEAGTVAKTGSEVGRYTLTFSRKLLNVRLLGAPGIVGPADAAFGNTAANAAQWRNASATSVDIQLFLASSGADTETTSGNIVHYAIEAQEL